MTRISIIVLQYFEIIGCCVASIVGNKFPSSSANLDLPTPRDPEIVMSGLDVLSEHLLSIRSITFLSARLTRSSLPRNLNELPRDETN